MVKPKIKKLTILLILPLLVLATLASSFLISEQASAATVYEAPCKTDEGHFAINPAWTQGDKSYGCVRNVVAGDWFAAAPDGSCFLNAPAYDVPPFGKACLYFEKITVGTSGGGSGGSREAKCTGDEENLITVTDDGGTRCRIKTDCSDGLGSCKIVQDFAKFTNFLSALVGVVVVAMIIVGGIQYSAAGGDASKVAAAKTKIFNALLALVIYMFMYAFLQWLVPGGVFG